MQVVRAIIAAMGTNPNCAWSQLDVYHVIMLFITNSAMCIKHVIVLAVMLLELKCHAHQCRQFVVDAAICADETLISLNILNSNEHTHDAQQTREGKWVRCAA